MNRPDGSTPIDEHVVTRHRRPHRWLAITLAALSILFGLALAPASPAAADAPVTQTAKIATECYVTSSVINTQLPALLEMQVTSPTNVERGQTIDVTITLADIEVPTEVPPATVNNVSGISNKFKVPSGFQLLSIDLNGGNVVATKTINPGGTFNVNVAGPVAAGTLVEVPEIVLHLKATGSAGTVGKVEWLQSLVNVNATYIINVNALTTCVPYPGNEAAWNAELLAQDPPLQPVDYPYPGPGSTLAEVEILPGYFIPSPAVEDTLTNTKLACAFDMNGTAASGNFTIPFKSTHRVDQHPDSFSTFTIEHSPYTWQANITALASSTRRVNRVRNLTYQIAIPAGFDVGGVSTTAPATATWDSSTRRVTFVFPPHTGTGTTNPAQVPATPATATSSPPPLNIQLHASGTSANAVPDFMVASYSIDYLTEQRSSVLSSTWTTPTWRTTSCNLPKSFDCVFDFNGTAASGALEPVFNVTGSTSVASGTTVNATIAMGPYNWTSAVTAFTSNGDRRVNNIRNVGYKIKVPDGFNVNTVTTTTGATVSYSSATRLITYLSTATHTGSFTPPAITVNMTSTQNGANAQSFDPTEHSFRYNTQTGTPFLIIFWTYGGDVQRDVTCGGRRSASLGDVQIQDYPIAVNDEATVGNNSSVEISPLANDITGSAPIRPETMLIVDEPLFGTVETDPDTQVVTYTPELGTPIRNDSFSYLVEDTVGRASNIAVVNIDIVGLFCYAPCSLDQFLEFDVTGDVLSMEQAGQLVHLQDFSLNGDPTPTSGLLQEITVFNRRGDGATWSLTGQVTDFKETETSPDCPASNPATWDYRCIPGDNLGWEPVAAVGHNQVPGDVASVTAGDAIDEGLSSSAQALCQSDVDTLTGGTFSCGALLTLLTPASAAAQTYQGIITLTLA